MPPDDPLGRHGPSLDEFLRRRPLTPENRPPNCPYAKKCTYGNKCKYYHPERGKVPLKSVADNLAEQASRRLHDAKQKGMLTQTTSVGDVTNRPVAKKPLGKTKSVGGGVPMKKGLHRTTSLVPGAHLQSKQGRGGASAVGSGGGRSTSPNLLLTNPRGEHEMLAHAHAALTSQQLHLTGNTGSNFSSPRRTPSPTSTTSSPASCMDQHLLAPPLPINTLDGHMTLRNVLSDPSG